MLKVSSNRFTSLEHENLSGVRAFRTTTEVFGVQRTVVVAYNDNLFVAQSQTLLREIAKHQLWLRQLQHQLRRRRDGKVRKGKPPTLHSTQKKVDAWLGARHMKDLFHVKITEQHGLPALSYRFNHHAWNRLQNTLLGKNLFTDSDDWTDAQIVRAYRSQHHVENGFRCMKDPEDSRYELWTCGTRLHAADARCEPGRCASVATRERGSNRFG